MTSTKIEKLKQLIKANPNFVFLSGAGVSTLSGIPDFRSKNGLYQKFKNAEYLLSHEALINDTEAFYKFYKEQMLLNGIKPNIIHNKLANWEKENRIGYVITQNIDGLHSLAGNERVVELHGTVHRNYCLKCNTQYSLKYIKDSDGIPKCKCGGLIRPDVVLYGESLHEGVFETCYDALNKTDLLIVAGTGLTVSTAGGIVSMFKGKHLVILNNEATPFDYRASLIIRDDLANIFKQLS